MNKSLAPLIIFLALIILATFIIVNSRSDRSQKYGGNNAPSSPNSPRSALDISLDPIVTGRQAPVRPYQRTKRAQPEDIDSYKALTDARSFIAEGQMGAAEDALRTLLVFNSDNAAALSLLGGILYATGRYEEASVMLQKRLATQPTSAAAHDELGLILWGKNDSAGAAGEFRKACELSHDSPAYLIHLAGLSAVAGQKDEALLYFAKAADALGPRIVPLSFDAAFDAIRSAPEFIAAVEKARQLTPAASTPLKEATPTPSTPSDSN